MAGSGFTIGAWCWFTRQASPCRVIERQDVWGEVAYRVWLPAKDAVVRARSVDLASLESVRPSVEQILHTTAAAKLLDALEDNLLLAPIQSSVVPLPHQLYALNRAVSRDRIRYLLADEVGLGKAAGRVGRQPAAGADPVERGAAAASALCAQPRHEPRQDPLSARG